MRIDYDYLDRVRRMAELFTKRKTSDLLEGDYSSRHHGRSMDFDDLREYRYGDDVNDIDWKSSSRTGKTLIRRYFADRKHDVIFVGDVGSKMLGDTVAGESKENLALMIYGSAAYLFGKQGINYSLMHSGPDGTRISSFMGGAAHLEETLYHYQKAIEEGEPVDSLRAVLDRMASSFERHMVMIIITDSEGIAEMDENLIRKLTFHNDVYIFNIEDAFLTTPNAFDMQKKRLEDLFLTTNKRLHKEEVHLRETLENDAKRLFKPNQVLFRKISREDEIVDLLVDLFRERREL